MPAMDTKKRTLIKALTWQSLGFGLMTFINYFYMGNLAQGLSLSALLTTVGLVTYFLHERIWASVAWGRAAVD
jgi:uncharacterized membrane protein